MSPARDRPSDKVKRAQKKAAGKATGPGASAPGPKLLSGGNPQIPKGYGDAPVQAYLSAIPGWKQEVARRIDALVVRTVPEVEKAVKWNSPLYGLKGQGWFLGMHVFTNYVKLTFFRGGALHPVPPGLSKYPQVRYLDIRERAPLDEAQLEDWIAQASRLPGERM